MTRNEMFLKIKNNWDSLAKPIDGLGEFESVLSKIGAVQGDEKIALDPGALIVFISDNGIIEEGVSQSGSEVTFEVAKALGMGKSTVCHMAKASGMKVVPVNVGMKADEKVSGVINKCISNGTCNFAKEPSMNKEQLNAAVEAGRDIVRMLKKDGVKILALGEMGIGNTTTSAAVLAGILKLNGKMVCSRGAGLSDEGLKKKISVVDSAILKYNLTALNPLDIVMTVGGYDIAALIGAILQANEDGIPVISDGFITGVAALIAYRIDERVKDIVIFSHNGRENGMKYILDEFDAKPVISADMALGEGTGACIFMSAARCALSVYNGGTLFSDINIVQYERFV